MSDPVARAMSRLAGRWSGCPASAPPAGRAHRGEGRGKVEGESFDDDLVASVRAQIGEARVIDNRCVASDQNGIVLVSKLLNHFAGTVAGEALLPVAGHGGNMLVRPYPAHTVITGVPGAPNWKIGTDCTTTPSGRSS